MMARKFFKEVNGENPAIVFELVAPTGFAEITDRDEKFMNMKREKKTEREYLTIRELRFIMISLKEFMVILL